MPSGYGHWTGENSGRPWWGSVLIGGAVVVGFVKLVTSHAVERVAGDVGEAIALTAGGLFVLAGAAVVTAVVYRRRHPSVPPWERARQLADVQAELEATRVELAAAERRALAAPKVLLGEVVSSDERIETWAGK